MLEANEIVHVIERRRFDTDLRRHFIGRVTDANAHAFRCVGYTFVFDSSTDRYDRLPECRTRIFPNGSDGLIINVAPANTDIENVHYVSIDGHLTVSDYGAFSLSVNEFGTRR